MKQEKKKMKRIILLVILGMVLVAGQAFAADYYNWNTRLDRHGKLAGFFIETPFPINENTETYTIQNDEYPTGRVFHLGNKYYVDGGYVGSSDGSWEKPWSTISTALDQVSEGNNTIIIRGAHDGFDGIYYERGLTFKSGVDATHPFIIVGYDQERPEINGESDPTDLQDTFSAQGVVTYGTIQRVKICNNYRNGVRTASNDSYLNVIDVWLYNNDKYNYTYNRTMADGNLYFLSSDNCWIFHSTSEHCFGHGIKIGDDANDNTVEWTVVKDIGYWDGFPFNSYFGCSSTGIDFPNDRTDSDGDGSPDLGRNNVIRYNIVSNALYMGVQIRRCPNFSMHHNEIFNTCKYDDVDMSIKGVARGQIGIGLYDGPTYGKVYSNVIRNPGSLDTPGLTIGACDNASNPQSINIYNNLIYGTQASESGIAYLGEDCAGIIVSQNVATDINILNNSIHTDTKLKLLLMPRGSWTSGVLRWVNNIFYKEGLTEIIGFNGYSEWGTHTSNIYNSSQGIVGITLDDSEQEADPLWLAIPSSGFNMSLMRPTENSPLRDQGNDLSAYGFVKDFIGTIRSQENGWDIGAYEYMDSSTAPQTPTGLKVLRVE